MKLGEIMAFYAVLPITLRNFLFTRFRFNLSHLRSHKFKHSFEDSLNPLCTCGIYEELISYFLLHWPSSATEKFVFLAKLEK